MNLPSKDKNGNSYLSYTQINTFLTDKEQFKKTYILREPFVSNDYIEFGIRVGKAIEVNDFSSFTDEECSVLNKCTRLDLFEHRINLKYDGFYLKGYIDTCSNNFEKIIDYKTGGTGKESKYKKPDYIQLGIYALALRQEYGVKVNSAKVEFITREGKPGKLKVANIDPIVIETNISEDYLKYVYNGVKKVASMIETFYLQNLQIQ